MIPMITVADLTKAKYTKLFNDISPENKEVLIGLFAGFGTAFKLEDHIYAKYRYYEICNENEDVFIQCMKDTYNEYVDYYTELLNIYLKTIDFDTILNKSSTRTDSSATQEAGTVSGSNDTTHKEYDLPNKVVDPTNENGYLTSKDTTGVSTSGNTATSRNNSYSSTNLSKDNRDFIKLKVEYLNHIRDIYDDFADRFYDCFLHIY